MGGRKINRTVTFNALKVSEERFRNMVETLSDWVWEVDENAVYSYSSPRVFDLLGYKPEEIIGRTPFDLMPPEEAARVSEIFGPIALEQRPFDRLENMNLHKDGHSVVLETSGVPFYSEAGNFCGYRGVDRDITAREKINQQLKEKEAAFATAQKIARVGDFERDIASGELYWSEELYRILGLTPGQFPATFQAFLAVIHPDDLELFKKTIDAAIKEKRPFDMDYRIILPDGSEKTVHVRGEAVFDDSGRAAKTRGTVQDITERKRAEDELRRLSSIIEQTDDFVATADENRQVLYYNRAARRILGLGSDEDLSRIHIPSTHTKWAWDIVLNKGIPTAIRDGIWTGETAFLNRNGEETPVLQTIIAHKSPRGEVQYLSTIARDISEIKKLEIELRERNLLLQALIDSIPDMFYYKDIHGRYMIVNGSFTKFVGLRKEEITGKAPEELFLLNTAKDVRESDEVILRAIESLRFEYPTVDSQGNKMVLDIIKTPVINKQAEVIGMLGVLRDITEKKETEEKLARARESLEKYNEELETEVRQRTAELLNAKLSAEAANIAKSDFIANMSHEIRTPLNAIIGFTEFMKDGRAGRLSEEQTECLSDMWESGRHLLRIINDILDIARIEAGVETELDFREFPLKAFIEQSLSVFRERALKHSISISFAIPEDTLHCNIIADELRIRQVLFNLLSNALKFTPRGGAVNVQAQIITACGMQLPEAEENKTGIAKYRVSRPCCLEVSVKDTGIGIAEENINSLFRPFHQLEKPFTKKYEGTGLGLYLSRKIIDLHKGRIWVESVIGEGSRFSFRIPVRAINI